MNRKVKLAFLASLIVNVLLLGVILGQSPRRFDREDIRQQRLERVLKNLPEGAQSRLREKYQGLRAAAEPHFKQIREAQDGAVRLLGAEPFDEAAYDRQVMKINELRMAMTEELSQIVKDAVKDLPPEERRRFAEMLQRPPPPKGAK
jgi:uncharacterized membrane protein